MSIFNDFFHIKQSPILSLLGMGGGGTGTALGGGASGPAHSASGASIFDVESNGRAVIQFNAPGSITFNRSMSGKDLRMILIGGGASGTRGNAGGGGAGGMIEITAASLGAGTYPVSIGNGGAVVTSTSTKGNDGSNSTFGPGLTAYGGGTGGRDGENANPGGSGGGGGYGVTAGSATQPGFSIPGTYTGTNYGNVGSLFNSYKGGGGGGAGGAGGPQSSGPARVGGAGRTVPSPNFPGVPFSGQLIGGGGGGSDRYTNGQSTGGPGGGGEGCSCNDSGDGYVQSDPSCASNANYGTANTGGGGGGSRCSNSVYPQQGGAGGSGLCIVSYTI